MSIYVIGNFKIKNDYHFRCETSFDIKRREHDSWLSLLFRVFQMKAKFRTRQTGGPKAERPYGKRN